MLLPMLTLARRRRGRRCTAANPPLLLLCDPKQSRPLGCVHLQAGEQAQRVWLAGSKDMQQEFDQPSASSAPTAVSYVMLQSTSPSSVMPRSPRQPRPCATHKHNCPSHKHTTPSLPW